MIRCWYLTFLLILATPLYCLADESSNQGISYFHTDSYSQQGQDYYIHVHKKNQASELIKHTMLDDLEKLDRIASFRTRFIIQNIGELEREIFHSPKTYEFINRKSEFEIISKNFFSGH